MEIIRDKTSYFRKLTSILTKNCKVKISTFNIYTGILDDGRYVNDWSGKFFNNVGALFDIMTLKSCSVHIKVGAPRKSDCPLKDKLIYDINGTEIDGECSLNQRDEKWDKRFAETKKRWHRFKFDLIDKSHTKLILISPNHCLFGGRNLSDSDDNDLSFYIADDNTYKELTDIFNEIK